MAGFNIRSTTKLFKAPKVTGLPGLPKLSSGPSLHMPRMSFSPHIGRPHEASSSMIRNMTGGLGMEQAAQAAALSSQTGVNMLTPPENAGLPTQPSKLQGFLDTINRPLYGLMGGLHETLDQVQNHTFDANKIAGATSDAFNLKTGITGADLGTKAGIFPENPQSLSGKFYKAVGGTTIETLLNPLNALHIGKLSPEAEEAFSKKGTGMIPGAPAPEGTPETDLSRLGLPGGVPEQLQSGLRSLASFGPLRTPHWMDWAAGAGLKYLRNVAMSTHVGQVIHGFFNTGKTSFLRGELESMKAHQFKDLSSEDFKKFDTADQMKNSAVADYKAGKLKFHPDLESRMESEGYKTPEDKVFYASSMAMDKDIIGKYPETIKNLTKAAAFKSGMAQMLKDIARTKENGLFYKMGQKSKGVKVPSKDFYSPETIGRPYAKYILPENRPISELAAITRFVDLTRRGPETPNEEGPEAFHAGDVGEGKKILNIINRQMAEGIPRDVDHPIINKHLEYLESYGPEERKEARKMAAIYEQQPPELNKAAGESYAHDALAQSKIVKQFQKTYDHLQTLNDPRIMKYGDYLREINDQDIIPNRLKAGLATMEGGEFGAPRAETPEATALRQAYKPGVTSGHGGGRKLLETDNYNHARALKEWSLLDAHTLFPDLGIRKTFFPAYGEGDFQKNPTVMQSLGFDKTSKPLSLFKMNPQQALMERWINARQVVHSLDLAREIFHKYGALTPEEYRAKGGLGAPSVATIPTTLQKEFGPKQFFTDPRIAQEFNSMIEKISTPRALNEGLRMLDNVRFLLSKMTLFGSALSPTYYLATVNRNLFGHTFFSYLRGALSPKGYLGATLLTKLMLFRDSLMKAGKWETAKAGLPTNWKGLNLRQAMQDLEDRGVAQGGETRQLMPDEAQTGLDKLNKAIDAPWITGTGRYLDQIASFFIRSQHYLTRLDQGYAPGPAGAAMNDMEHSMIDYNPEALSDSENAVAKRVFQFYAFMRFNTTLMMQAILQHPGRIARVGSAINNIEATFGQPAPGQKKPNEDFLDSFIKGNLHMRIFQDDKGNWNYFVLKNFLPFADMEDFSSLQNLGDKIMSSLFIPAKVAGEEATGKSFYFRDPTGQLQNLERYPGEQGEILGRPVSKKVEVAIKELLRPVNSLDQFNPFNLFGMTGTTGEGGAYRGKSDMTTSQKVSAMLGLRPRVYDEQRAAANAQFNFRQQFNTFRDAAMRAQKVGDTPNYIMAVQRIRQLRSQATPTNQ